MANMSTLRPSKEHLERFTKTYATHRPLIQRSLTVSFVLYALAATYWGLSGRAASQQTRSRKGKEKADDKAAKHGRVAVRASLVFYEMD